MTEIIKYKVPDYIIKVCQASNSLTIFNDLLYSLENGESLWKNIKNNKFKVYYSNVKKYANFPLYTKKECHLFLNVPVDIINQYAPTQTNVVEVDGLLPTLLYIALVYSLVIANGGSLDLIEHLINYRFRKDIFVEEIAHIKYKIIKWLCKIEKEIKIPADWFLINPAIDYLLDCFKHDKNYSLKDRTLKSVQKQMEIWHKNLKLEQYSRYPQTWNSTTYINNFEIDFEGKTYTISEILSAEELYQEGKELNHCVLSYIENIHNEKCTIWSLKENGKRSVTIELNVKFLKQCRGYKNRYVTNFESSIIKKWTDKENITVISISWF